MPDVRSRADALRFYASGATQHQGEQNDAHTAFGGYRSVAEVRVLETHRSAALRGIRIMFASGENGEGTGVLSVAGTDELTWQAPGEEPGAAVAIASGETVLLESETPSKFLRVRRVDADAISGEETVRLCRVRNNMIGFPNVLSAEAVAGNTDHLALFIVNESDAEITDLELWIDEAAHSLRIGEEAPVANAIQVIADKDTAPIGITFTAGSTSGTGVSIASLAAGEMIGLWLERALAADTTEGPAFLQAIRYGYTLEAVNFTGWLGGLYGVARDDAAYWGLFLGQDTAPDFSAPSETFTAVPHDTTVTLLADSTYQWAIRRRSRYGLWSLNIEPGDPIVVNATGGLGHAPPSPPEDLSITATSGHKMNAQGIYYPAVDGANRASLFVIWIALGEDPDPEIDAPTGFQVMSQRAGRSLGIEHLDFTTDAFTVDAAPVHFIARTRMVVDEEGTPQTTNTVFLPASGAGTIETDGSYSDWPATGYARVSRTTGALKEYVEYSSRTDTVLTIDAAGRALWGSTATEGEDSDTVTPVVFVDSTNEAVVTGSSNLLGPPRPSPSVFFGEVAAQHVDRADPDGTAIALSGGYYVEQRPGDSRLYAPDSSLIWRVIYSSEQLALSGVYINNVYDIDVAAEIPASGAGMLEIDVNGVAAMLIDPTGTPGFITVLGLEMEGDLPAVSPQEPFWHRYADTLLQVWDIATDDYVPWSKLTATGWEMQINMDIALTEAEILDLEVP